MAACKNILCAFKIVKFNENLEEIEIINGTTTINDWGIRDCSSSNSYTIIFEKNSAKYFMLADSFIGSSGWATRYYELPDYFSGSNIKNKTIIDNEEEGKEEENEQIEEKENEISNEKKENEEEESSEITSLCPVNYFFNEKY